MKNSKTNNIFNILINEYKAKSQAKKDRELYNKITDWAFPLLDEMRRKKKQSYKNTVHINYYASVIGKELGLDEDLIKAGASYSCIFSIFDNNKDTLFELIDDIEFPQKLINLLEEIGDDNCAFTLSEAFIISLCKTFVLALNKLIISGKPVVKLYPALVDSVMKAYYNGNRIKHLNLTFNDFTIIRDIFLKEIKYLKIMNN